MHRYGPIVSAGVLLLSAGCPWDAPSDAPTTQNESEGVDVGAGVAGAAARASVEAAIAEANGVRFPPAPKDEVLCKLRVKRTDYDSAKMLLGKPQTEGMDAMFASMSFRFSLPKGAPKAQGADAYADQSVMIYLSFAWRDGLPDPDKVIEGVEPTAQDGLRGYILSEASISGLPYPKCWPHIEPKDAD